MEDQMAKLLNKYRANKTISNARMLRAYERLHPMAVCSLTREDADLLADAIHQANMEG
jgi:hypothetical protein